MELIYNKNLNIIESKFFDLRSLLLFKNFLITNDESDFKMIQYDFTKKILESQNNKEFINIHGIYSTIDEYFIIDTYLNFLIALAKKKQFKIKSKILKLFRENSLKKLEDKNIEKIEKLYTRTTDPELNKSLCTKKPFCFFDDNKNNKNIFEEKEKFEAIFHMVLHYTYYILIKYFHDNGDKTINENLILHPRLLSKKIENFIKNFKENNSSTKISSRSLNPIHLLNKILNLYKNLNSKLQKFFYNNESVIEILFHFIIQESYLHSHDKTLTQEKFNLLSKIKLFRNLNKKIVIQTGIMLLNKNKKNEIYKANISSILSVLISQNYSNFLTLVNIFDNSNLNFDACRILIKKLFCSLPKNIKSHLYYKKIISNIFQIILTCNKNNQDENNQGLKEFLIELMIEIVNSFKDDEKFIIVLFNFLYLNFLKKFNVKICWNREEEFNIDINHIDCKENFISKNFLEYLQFLMKNLDFTLNSAFCQIFENNKHNLFRIFFKILTKCLSKNKIYYDNLKDEQLQTLLNFIVMHFEYVNPSILSDYFLKYFTKNIFKINSISSRDFNLEKIHFNFDKGDAEENNLTKNSNIFKITNLKRNFRSNLENLSSIDFFAEINNSLENICNLKQFKNLEFLKEILSAYMTEKISLKTENIIDLEEFHLQMKSDSQFSIYSEEEIDDMIIPLEKVNILYNTLKQKIFILTINSLTNYEDISSIFESEDIFKFFSFILNSTSDIFNEKNELLDGVLNCLGVYLAYANKNSNLLQKFSIRKEILLIISFIKSKNFDSLDYPPIEQINEEISKFMSLEFDDDNLSELNNCIANNNDKVVEFKNKIEIILSRLSNAGNNYEKSCIINEINLTFKKFTTSYCSESPLLDLNFFQVICNVLLKNFKITDLFLWKNIQKCFITVLEFFTYKRNFIEFFFLTIKSHFEEFAKVSLNSFSEIDTKANVSFPDQSMIKILELIDKIIIHKKQGSAVFCRDVIEFIFEIFNNYFYLLNPTIISGCISVCSNLINYGGLEMSFCLSTLIRTSLNLLKNINQSVELKRSAALLLLKIIQNCEFEHFKVNAKEIYACVKFNTDNIENDKVVRFHLLKCLEIIKISVQSFYLTKEISDDIFE